MDRRAFLKGATHAGAVLALPAALAAANVTARLGRSPSDTAQWRQNIQRYEQARQTLDDEDNEERWDELTDAENAAMFLVMTTPAPDGAALAEKMRIYAHHEIDLWLDEYKQPIRAAMLDDAEAMRRA